MTSHRPTPPRYRKTPDTYLTSGPHQPAGRRLINGLREALDALEELVGELDQAALRRAWDAAPNSPRGEGPALTPLLRPKDVAAMLQCSPSSVYRFCLDEDDPLPFTKVANSRRFLQRDVDEWLARHRSDLP